MKCPVSKIKNASTTELKTVTNLINKGTKKKEKHNNNKKIKPLKNEKKCCPR